MKSIKIFGLKPDEMWPTIKRLHRDILNRDEKWHFFFEGNYILIRCQEKFESKVSEWFAVIEGALPEPAEAWVDNIPATKKYQGCFEHIFHGFSELALQLDNDINLDEKIDGWPEFDSVLERVIHCYANMASQCKGSNLSSFLGEASAIARVALLRAFSMGVMQERHQFASAMKKGSFKNMMKEAGKE